MQAQILIAISEVPLGEGLGSTQAAERALEGRLSTAMYESELGPSRRRGGGTWVDRSSRDEIHLARDMLERGIYQRSGKSVPCRGLPGCLLGTARIFHSGSDLQSHQRDVYMCYQRRSPSGCDSGTEHLV